MREDAGDGGSAFGRALDLTPVTHRTPEDAELAIAAGSAVGAPPPRSAS